jgi:undecaprenyl-phosphate 4-deoxy-4-formamido-L-arabinose transferase
VDISVVIPVYNEYLSLPHLFIRLSNSMSEIGKPYELIFVDDASTDESLRVLEEFSDDNDCVKIVNFRRNKGQHRAIIAGMQVAGGEIVVTIDADMQTPPEEI